MAHGKVEVQVQTFFGFTLNGVTGQLHASVALDPRKHDKY